MKGSRHRLGSKGQFDKGHDQIEWASKRRRGGRAANVIQDKTKYDRKKYKGEDV